MSRSKILFQISGSIAAYKACAVISRLVQEGHEVQVVATPATEAFVGWATLEGLTGRKVLSRVLEQGQAMDHIHWARWADLAILCPATAHTLNRLAAGLADDLIGSLFLAFGRAKPYLIAPAMNSEMYAHPRVQESLKTLASWGCQILPTETGRLACGEIGEGKLLETEAIHAAIHARLQGRSRGRLLITAGATREPIDGVRFISNISTGATGALMAERFSALGFDVTYLHGEGALIPQVPGLRRLTFTSHADLDRKLKDLLGSERFTAVIQAAAVSDFSVVEVHTEDRAIAPDRDRKLASGGDLRLELKPNFKIVERLKAYSSTPVKVVAFKLTQTPDREERVAAVNRLLHQDAIDAVVHNDLAEVTDERDGRRHVFRIFRKGREPEVCEGKSDMIDKLGVDL